MHRLPLLVLPLVLLVASCGDDDPAVSDGGDHMSGGMSDAMPHGGNSPIADGARVIAIRATSFEFDPPTLRAGTGENLAIELTSEDIEHDFTIDELAAHVAADGGDTASGGFSTGDDQGTFTYYCSVPGHRDAGMEGELIIE